MVSETFTQIVLAYLQHNSNQKEIWLIEPPPVGENLIEIDSKVKRFVFDGTRNENVNNWLQVLNAKNVFLKNVHADNLLFDTIPFLAF